MAIRAQLERREDPMTIRDYQRWAFDGYPLAGLVVRPAHGTPDGRAHQRVPIAVPPRSHARALHGGHGARPRGGRRPGAPGGGAHRARRASGSAPGHRAHPRRDVAVWPARALAARPRARGGLASSPRAPRSPRGPARARGLAAGVHHRDRSDVPAGRLGHGRHRCAGVSRQRAAADAGAAGPVADVACPTVGARGEGPRASRAALRPRPGRARGGGARGARPRLADAAAACADGLRARRVRAPGVPGLERADRRGTCDLQRFDPTRAGPPYCPHVGSSPRWSALSLRAARGLQRGAGGVGGGERGDRERRDRERGDGGVGRRR